MTKKVTKKNKKRIETKSDFLELDDDIMNFDEEIENDEVFDSFEDDEKETEVTIMDMLNRIVACLIIIAVILGINTLVLIFKDGTISNKDSNISSVENTYSTEDYDVSKMNAVTLKGAVQLFTSKNTYVLYIGRSTCSACRTYVPTLNSVASSYGVTIQYLDVNNISSNNENYSEFIKKLDYETTVQTDDGEENGTFGEFLGYTPMTIIIKNGKQVNGAIGAIDKTSLEALFDEYDIGK